MFVIYSIVMISYLTGGGGGEGGNVFKACPFLLDVMRHSVVRTYSLFFYFNPNSAKKYTVNG